MESRPHCLSGLAPPLPAGGGGDGGSLGAGAWRGRGGGGGGGRGVSVTGAHSRQQINSLPVLTGKWADCIRGSMVAVAHLVRFTHASC